jgi:hypothetical protein
MILFFERFGRYKDICLPISSSKTDDVLKLIKKHYRKYLMSTLISVEYDEKTTKGNIYAGFQHVGVFEVKPTIISLVKEEKPQFNLQPSLIIERSGYISPNGDYYACKEYGHNDLAEKLQQSGLTQKRLQIGFHNELEGWIHLSLLQIYHELKYPLTQKQIDFLFLLFKQFNLDKTEFNGVELSLKQILEQNKE